VCSANLPLHTTKYDTPTSLLCALGPAPLREKQWEQATEGNHLESDYPM
jgi:hypothetical protein